MKTILNHIFKRTIVILVLLTITAVSALSSSRATINISAIAEVTSFTVERYIPLTTRSISLTLEWRNTPMSASALVSYINSPLSAYGVTATAYVPSSSIAHVTLSRPSTASENLDIVITDYAGEKTIHWVRPEDVLTADKNWIEIRTFHGTGEYDYHSDVTYYNGLGLPEMHVSGAASGTGKSIVTPVVYDECMRAESILPLPFEGTDVSLKMVSDSEAEQAYEMLYGADADYAYTANTFDSYSLNRPVLTVMPGMEGRDRSKATVMEHSISTLEDKVFNLQYDPVAQTVLVPSSPVYLAGLEKTVCRDEDDRTVIKFTDALGREVLSRQLDGTDQTSGLDTYTVYDGAGRPVWVISPKGSMLLTSSTAFRITGSLATEWSTIYRYDSFGRMIERKLPGCGTEYYVYDAGDRLLLYQDGNLRVDGNKWVYRVYDKFGHEIEKTVVVPVNPSMSVDQIRNLFSDVRYSYPDLCGVADYRLPVSGQTFTFDKSLSCIRYGGQSYRTGFSNPTAVSAFTVPADLAFAVVVGVVLPSDLGVTTAHQKVYEKVWILGDASAVNAENDYVVRAFYYDTFGRVVQIVEKDPWGGKARISTKYDRLGNILACKESRSLPASGSASAKTVIKMTTCTYDNRGRILTEVTEISGTVVGSGKVSSSVLYDYDELGRLKGVTTGCGTHTEKKYTTQGWLDMLHAIDASSANVFSQEFHYCQSGLISEVTSRQGSSAAMSYGVTYDRIGRMTDWQQNGTNVFAEKGITYDANGNILTMKRYGADASLESDYSYAYSGNMLTSLTDGYRSTSSFGYDANGNLVSDSRNGIVSVAYNELNLPQRVTFTDGEADYLYFSDGTKLSALKDGSGLIYCGSMVYSGSFSSSSATVDFESTGFSSGRLVKKGSAVQPEYHVNDYLCSVRVVTDAYGEVLEHNDYSGFGFRLACSTGSVSRYRFGGKEEQGFSGVPWQDFGARMYDSALARWTTPDPLADKYPGISAYAYCNGDPVNFSDPDGRLLEDPIRNPEIRRNRASNLYGEGIRFNGTQYRNHQGFDYYAPEGTDVMSVKDGIVVNIVEGHKDYGNSVTIEHVNAENRKVYTFYAHLSEINVVVDDVVKEGQIIAKTGITGNASNLKGADQHLHFELRSHPENASGLTGKMDPNEIVDTKFESQNPHVNPQTNIGIIKIHKDGTKEYLEIIR